MNGFGFRCVAAVLAVLLAVPAGLDAGLHADARKGTGKGGGKSRQSATKTVTRMFANNGQIAIPTTGQATPYPVVIDVKGFARGRIKDVDLTLRGINHGGSDQIDIMLVAPNGRNAVVLSDLGNGNVLSNVTLTLDDEAVEFSPVGPYGSGRFQPVNVDGFVGDTFPAPAPLPSGIVALATIDGGDPNGAWKLYATDDVVAGGGSIAGGWDLTIEATIEKRGGKGKGGGAGKGGKDGKGKGKGKGNGKGR